jgi:hypothetical protein
VIVARVDLIQAEAFTEGSAVTVRIGSDRPLDSTVTAVSEFQPAADSEPPGYEISVALPSEVDASSVSDQPITLDEQGEVNSLPAVPLTAIRYDDQQPTVWLVETPDKTGATAPPSLVRVPVEVTGQSSGYAILVANPDLPIGAAVVVSGE